MTSSLRTTQVNLKADFIDFGIGQPGFSILSLDVMRQAAEHRLGIDDTSYLIYGAEAGDGQFRQALANFLSTKYGAPAAAHQFCTTAGASQALDLICTLYTEPGDIVFAEEPSYFLALRIFEDHKLRVMGVPTDENGMDMEALAEMLNHHKPKFVYTIPTFQNPAGFTLPTERRLQLITLSQIHNFKIVADEVYHCLAYGDPPPPAFGAYTGGNSPVDSILSVGSFSKIMAPGLRLGWIQAAPKVIDRIALCGLIDSGGGLNHFVSGLVRSALELGLQEQYLDFLKQTFRARIDAMDAALQAHVSEWVAYTRPQGGYFFWLTLPEEADTAELQAKARRRNVSFQPGVRFSSNDALDNCLRLSFAFYEEADLVEGVRRLGEVLREM